MSDNSNPAISKFNLFEIIGVTSILASLFFVGYELRQANKIARVETEWQLMNSYATWDEGIIACPECYVPSFSENMGVSTPEFNRNQSIIYRAINTWQAAEIGYDEGLLSERTFNLFYRDANHFITTAKEVGTLDMWRATLDETSEWAESITYQHLYSLINGVE
jgi:hypothetical protein